MDSLTYDLFVIGAGSGGLAAAERAATYGIRVAIAEHANVGGACINYGCIPEKLLDYAAGCKLLNQIIASYGWSPCDRDFNWSNFMAAKDRHVQHLNELHRHHLKEAGVEFISGEAVFVDAHTLLIADTHITADKILIAVGAQPVLPKIPGIEQTITWRELYHLPHQPQHLAILGGDAIGVKVAGSMAALGTQVTQVIGEDHVLIDLDAELGNRIQERLSQQGVQVLSNTHVKAIEQVGDRLQLQMAGDYPETVQVDTVLVDAPRHPYLDHLNLAQAGVQLTPRQTIQVDEFSRTSQANIFAIGDCTDRIPLTPSAIAQARAFADTEFGGHPQTVSYAWVPLSVSSHPEAATVGLTEAQAREQFGDAVQCYYTQFRSLFYCLSGLKEQSWLKVIVNRSDSERVLGVHMIGDSAVEIIQSLAIALKLGATKSDLDQTIGIHPSTGEELFSL